MEESSAHRPPSTRPEVLLLSQVGFICFMGVWLHFKGKNTVFCSIWESKHYIILNKSTDGDAGIVLCSCRVVKRHRLFRKLLVGVSVGVPLVVGAQYAVSEPRERRKMKILAEGVGRFCRWRSFSNVHLFKGVIGCDTFTRCLNWNVCVHNHHIMIKLYFFISLNHYPFLKSNHTDRPLPQLLIGTSVIP